MSRRTRAAAVATAAALAVGAFALPAAAAPGDGNGNGYGPGCADGTCGPGHARAKGTGQPLGPRLLPDPADDDDVAAFCEHVDQARDRIQDRLERLQADEDVTGSLAWLRERFGAAQDGGRETVARVLERRLERRAERVERATTALERVEDAAATYCDAS